MKKILSTFLMFCIITVFTIGCIAEKQIDNTTASNERTQITITEKDALAYAANDAEMTLENNIVTVTNVPDNSTLITAFYNDNTLSDVKLYQGSGTITADISHEMANQIWRKCSYGIWKHYSHYLKRWR